VYWQFIHNLSNLLLCYNNLLIVCCRYRWCIIMSMLKNASLLVLTVQFWHSTNHNQIDYLLCSYYVILWTDYWMISADIRGGTKYTSTPGKSASSNAWSLYRRHCGYVVSRNSLLGTPLRPLLVSSISFINGVMCYRRIRSRTWTAHVEIVTRTHVSLHTFIPYGEVWSPWRESPWVRY